MIRRAFSSLKIRNFRLFMAGQLVSNVGTWCQAVALGWLVYTLTGSGTALGTVTAVQFVPALFLSMWGGLLADRFDKRKLLVVTQTAQAGLAAVLAGLVLSHHIAEWEVYVIAFLLGSVTAIDMPTRGSFVTEMVGTSDVANGVALNSVMVNLSRVIGPAFAGVLIKWAGLGWCFTFNAVSFGAVIAGLLAMRPRELHSAPPPMRAKRQVREGFIYAWRTPELRAILLVVAVVGTFAMNFPVVLAVLAKQVFHGGSGIYSILSAVLAIGSVGGAIWVAIRSRPTQLFFVGSCIGFGAFTLAAGLSVQIVVVCALLAIAGAASIMMMSTANAALQVNARADMRGRVAALYALVFLGSVPVGSPVIGWIAQHWGADVALGLSGAITAIAGLVALAVARTGKRKRVVPAELAGV
jgi:MFS family permease